jgi:hypothetical protein
MGFEFPEVSFRGTKEGHHKHSWYSIFTDSFSLFKAEITIKKKKRIVPELLNIFSLGKELDYPQKTRRSFVY